MSDTLFVSIGSTDQLAEFLSNNPQVPKSQVFVDDLDRNVYKSVNLSLATEKDTELVKEAAKTLSAPTGLGLGDWWNYMRNVVALSPIDKANQKFGDLPEGVLQLGGTFLLQNDKVVYQWMDRMPGDEPNLNDVLATARMFS